MNIILYNTYLTLTSELLHEPLHLNYKNIEFYFNTNNHALYRNVQSNEDYIICNKQIHFKHDRYKWMNIFI